MVTAVIDSRNRGPKVSGMGGGGGGKKSKSAKKRREHGVETKPPPEVILLPADPTLADLKAAATKCFQDLYVVLGKFKVRTVVGLENAKETQKVGKKTAGRKVEVHGEGADLQSEFRYQGGLDQWTVRCVCGTTDDDGERMIACDACEVWMHTRCVGIVDSAGTPRRWTCLECEAEAAAEAAKAAKAAKASGARARQTRRPRLEEATAARGGARAAAADEAQAASGTRDAPPQGLGTVMVAVDAKDGAQEMVYEPRANRARAFSEGYLKKMSSSKRARRCFAKRIPNHARKRPKTFITEITLASLAFVSPPPPPRAPSTFATSTIAREKISLALV